MFSKPMPSATMCATRRFSRCSRRRGADRMIARGRRSARPAIAYMWTSSAANVGVDRDSERRQRVAIQAYARRVGFAIADQDWFHGAAVSGADPIEGREGFTALLDCIEGNGVRIVLVEDASRFARPGRAGAGYRVARQARRPDGDRL